MLACSLCEERATGGGVQLFETIVGVLNPLVWETPRQFPWLVALLLGSGIFVTLRLGFIQLRQVRHALRVVAGRYDDPTKPGDISHFQALSTALSATVGIGNIAGVAVAIHYGGPGALFWMWLAAFFGMALKYAECTLSLHYRDVDASGRIAGGPMYYIEKGLGPRWKPLALFFAFCTITASFGIGNMNQSNTVAVSARTDLGAPEYVTGIITALLVGVVILGGIRRIGDVSSKLAPGMAIIYVISALLVVFLNIDQVPRALMEIVSGAFNPTASVGGSVAGSVAVTLVWGIRRSLFSNEAGLGSAPIAHAAAKTDEPAREGVVAMLGPLIDTLIICTLTGLVIVITGVWDSKHEVTLPVSRTEIFPAQEVGFEGTEYERVKQARAAAEAFLASGEPPRVIAVKEGRTDEMGFVVSDSVMNNPVLLSRNGKPFNGTVLYRSDGALARPNGTLADLVVQGEALLNSSALTAEAFRRGLDIFGSDWGNWVVTLSVFLFALSTMIAWSYYGDRATVYLLGHRYVIVYRLIYVGFVFLGAVFALRVVWDYGDLALGFMAVPNLIAVLALSPRVVRLTRDYVTRMQRS